MRTVSTSIPSMVRVEQALHIFSGAIGMHAQERICLQGGG